MTYASELAAHDIFQTNVVIKIGTTYFSKYAVDSGLTVDADKIVLQSASLNPSKIDLKTAKATIESATINVLDKDEVFSVFMGADSGALVNSTITIYLGRITGSFAWSDYLEVSNYIIKEITKKPNTYSIKAVSQVDNMQSPIFDVKGNLQTSINDSVTTIIVTTDGDIFQTSNYLKIEDELIIYTGKTYNTGTGRTTFTGCTRAQLDSTQIAHTAGVEVYEVYKATDNPIDMLLKLLISNGGGGSYDSYFDGLGISNSLIDVTAFESIRDTYFSGESFTIYLYDIPNALKGIQEELLLTCNVRFIESGSGTLSLAILDQSTLGETLTELDDTNTKANKTWKISKNTVQNSITFHWAWSEGLKSYTEITTATDSDSITKYGTKKGKDIKSKGVHTSAIVSDRNTRFLNRFATPQAEINCIGFMSESLITVADKIKLTSAELPQQGAGLGLIGELEVLNKAVDMNTGLVKFKLVFTSYTNLRRGMIAPSPRIVSITSQTVFNVLAGQGQYLKAGYVMRLWNNSTGVYESDSATAISTVSTDTITMASAWSTTLTTSHIIRFADYDDCVETQKIYGFINEAGNDFADGLSSFKIFL